MILMNKWKLRKKNKLSFSIRLCPLILLFFIYTPSYSSTLITQAASLKYQITSDGTKAFSLPSDVDANAKRVYIVDGGNHRIVVFDKQGKHLFSFGSHGDKYGQFNFPVGIFVSNNRVYVADSGNHRVQIFSDDGKFIRGFPLKHKGKSVRPVDLIVNSRSGNIIVSASEAHNLMVFSPTGKLLDQWGSKGTNIGEFRYPATIAEISDGGIAVVDVLNSRVQLFNSEGNASMTVSGWGVLQGQLVRPKGIAIDNKNNFYISDSYMNLVQIFSKTGEFISVLGDHGKPYQMVTPVGMLVDESKLYVVEMRAHRVSVYQLENRE
ncbi:MAG: NHL repeat-containing protein [Gammaproteobacteria bacterium]|nr:NHL repeat-containing protein [Gammaproteobacteria bacterium]